MFNKTIIFSIGVGVGILLTAVFIFVHTTLQNDGLMIFPRKPNGRFVKPPALVEEDQERYVEWIVPVKCSFNSYEVQEIGYTRDSGMLWGGNEKATCDKTVEGYQCRTEEHPEMKGKKTQWIIQAHGYRCSDGNDYISEPTVVY